MVPFIVLMSTPVLVSTSALNVAMVADTFVMLSTLTTRLTQPCLQSLLHCSAIWAFLSVQLAEAEDKQI